MSQLLKYAGVLYLLFSRSRKLITGAILDRVEYSFPNVKLSDIRLDIINGAPVGILRINMRLKQSFGLNLAADSLRLSLSQQDEFLGVVNVTERALFPNGQTVFVPFNVIVGAGNFLTRLEKIIVGDGQLFAPIEMKGTLTLSNGYEVPIRYQLQFDQS